METVDKLRDWARHVKDNPHLGTLTDLGVRGLDAIAYGIEREVAERYMELPVDADGVPIRVGDEMESDNERFVICAVAPGRVHRWHIHNIGELDNGTVAYPPESLHHFKPRTVEDVLEDFIAAYDEWDCNTYDDERMERRRELFDKYADELRWLGVEDE